jgi:hypothetical protein
MHVRLPSLLVTRLLALAMALPSLGCESAESPRVSLPVVVDATGVAPALTDLGYTVTLGRARAAVRDLQFTVGGETHATWLDRVGRALVPRAHAHPGHEAGGEITGELPGPLVIDWLDEGAPLGAARLVVGRYRGANFTFRRATAAELPEGDPLVGHTIHVEGTAARDGRAVSFVALVDVDDGARLVGAPFDAEIAPGLTASLGLRLLPTDPQDAKDTLWNGVDFFALAGAGGGASIAPGEEIHNLLRRKVQVHDHYDVRPRQGARR